MSPEQFLARLAKSGPEPAYLFLGPEAFERTRCRRALLDAVLPDKDNGERENGFTRHDLDRTPLAAALDDARALSLFASRRVIWLAGAEAAVPRGRSASDSDEEAETAQSALAAYLKEPTPDVTLVIDCSRYEFEGEDKPRMERVEAFFAAIPAKVEFRPYAPEAARFLAQKLAKEAGIQLGLAELALLLEATGGDASRIAMEIEKLRLFAGTARKITAADIAALVPDAQSSTIFVLVAALGRGDRTRALEILDTLSRSGEYMPLALTFLATQFRTALAAREAGLRGAGQIQAHFNKLGARMWPERARQIEQTMDAFSKERLALAVEKVFETDRGLRDARPDDRILMEEMILTLTAR
jgi:DNA polymerase-3 subunit delta